MHIFTNDCVKPNKVDNEEEEEQVDVKITKLNKE